MTHPQAIIFDLGGTLLHYHDSQTEDKGRHFRRITLIGVEAVYQALREAGDSLPGLEDFIPVVDRHIGENFLRTLQELEGGSIEVAVRGAFAELGVTLRAERWAGLRSLLYSGIDRIVAPRAGLSDTLETLRERSYTLALISNTFWASDLHDRHLKQFGILDYFPERIYSCDHAHVKPHPAIFKDMLDRLGVEPDAGVYVGDTPDNDIKGAQEAGMRAVLIESPYYSGGLNGSTPDATIAELPDLIPVLEGWQ